MKHGTMAHGHTPASTPTRHVQALGREDRLPAIRLHDLTVYVTGDGKTPIQASDRVARVAAAYLRS